MAETSLPRPDASEFAPDDVRELTYVALEVEREKWKYDAEAASQAGRDAEEAEQSWWM